MPEKSTAARAAAPPSRSSVLPPVRTSVRATPPRGEPDWWRPLLSTSLACRGGGPWRPPLSPPCGAPLVGRAASGASWPLLQRASLSETGWHRQLPLCAQMVSRSKLSIWRQVGSGSALRSVCAVRGACAPLASFGRASLRSARVAEHSSLSGETSHRERDRKQRLMARCFPPRRFPRSPLRQAKLVDNNNSASAPDARTAEPLLQAAALVALWKRGASCFAFALALALALLALSQSSARCWLPRPIVVSHAR